MEGAGGRGAGEPVKDPFERLGFTDAGRANDNAVRAECCGVEVDGARGFVDTNRHVEVAHCRDGTRIGDGHALANLRAAHTLARGGALGTSSRPRVVVLAPGGIEATAVGEENACDEDSGAGREG